MMLRTTRRRCQFVAWNSLKFHEWLGTAGIGPLLWWFPFGPSSRARIGRQKPPVFGMPGDHEQYIQNLSTTADVLLMHLQSQPHPEFLLQPRPKGGNPCDHVRFYMRTHIYQSNAARFQCLSTKRSRNLVFFCGISQFAAGGDERQHRWMERFPRRSSFGRWKLGISP